MEEKDLIPKIEISANLSDTLNETYKDSIQKPLQSGSKAITTVLDFFNNTVLYPMQKYNLYAESKLNDFACELKNKASKIPNENLIEPRVNILGPTIEGLKYNLDEEYIKEMFTNILLCDMDNRKQNNVLPSYINIVNQLSQQDAEFLALLNSKNLVKDLPISRLKLVSTENDTFCYMSKYFICLNSYEYLQINQLTLDNLLRLNIVTIPSTIYIANISYYDDIFNIVKKQPAFIKYQDISNKRLENTKEKLIFTDFGKNFINICLPKD